VSGPDEEAAQGGEDRERFLAADLNPYKGFVSGILLSPVRPSFGPPGYISPILHPMMVIYPVCGVRNR
jgi:hypothetical protein